MEVKRIDSSDENVCKYVFDFGDAVAEAVLYKYPTYEDRTVMCISTMSGCPVGCRFCGAGDFFARNLTATEIVQQVEYMTADKGIDLNLCKKSQIMYMSMGEPMLNLNPLMIANELLHEAYPKAALLISTSGPKVNYGPLIAQAETMKTLGLQFSVHESTDEARDKLIPYNNKLTIKEIASIGQQFYERTERRPYFNYCVHDKNNSAEDATNLQRLLDPAVWEATISVICERDESVSQSNARQAKLASDFRIKLADLGFSTRVFNPAGQDDIGGGCGQLHFVQKWAKENNECVGRTVGTGKPMVHTPPSQLKLDYLERYGFKLVAPDKGIFWEHESGHIVSEDKVLSSTEEQLDAHLMSLTGTEDNESTT